jgi:hypothetical protein
MERRVNPRLPLALDVVLNHHSQAVVCTTRDISVTGAFVTADRELLPYGGTIELGISLAAEPHHVRVPAKIQRVTDEGAAVVFGDVGRDVYFQLVESFR